MRRRKRRTWRNAAPLAALAFLFFFAACTAGGVGKQESSEQEQPAQEAAGTQVLQSGPRVMTAHEMQNTFREVARTARPVVVQINVVQVVQQAPPSSPFDYFFGPRQGQPQERRREGLGSGVIVRSDGSTAYVLTNNHVVADANQITVQLHDGRTFPAKTVGRDPRLDLALVSFKASKEVPLAALGDSDTLQVGDWVLAVGNPLGLESTVTAGIVSALGRTEGPASSIASFIQTDAAINPGNSGGALVNIDGQVIGINTWIASTTGAYIGFGFAIPVNTARKAIDDFITKGRIEYGWLGVAVRDVLPATARDLAVADKSGAAITNIYLDSPAARAGLQPGDFLTSVAGQEVANQRDLTRLVGTLSPGDSAEFRFVRYGRPMSLSVTVAERGSEEELRRKLGSIWPGMLAVNAEDAAQLSISGGNVLVAMVYEGTPAARAGLQQGDVVQEVGGRRVGSMMDFYRGLNEGGGSAAFQVLRGGSRRTLELSR